LNRCHVVEPDREKGLPAPVNAALAALVREIEAGTRSSTADSLEGLLR
jgi:hypothetical protein